MGKFRFYNNEFIIGDFMNTTKGQLEGKISEAIIKFEKEYMGRGPLETKTYVIDDMILVRYYSNYSYVSNS